MKLIIQRGDKTKIVVAMLLLFTLLAFGATRYRNITLQNSTVDSSPIGATTPSSVKATTFQATTSMLAGAGFQFVRVASCTTAASGGASCNTTVTWPVAFADTNYSYGCSSDGNGAANFETTASASKTASTFVAVIINTPGNSAATSVTLSCWGAHD